jgi:hypothetical protein
MAGESGWLFLTASAPTLTIYCASCAMSPPNWGAATEENVTAEPPRPLMRELPPADPFPVDALGNVLGAAARAIHDRVQAPMAICGNSVLGAANLSVQGHGDVALPIGPGQAKPVSSYFITIAESGERKSECDKQALWPIRARERALRDMHDAELPTYLNDKAAWEKARDHAVKKGAGDRGRIRAALDALGPAPSRALQPMLTCEEPTIEGLHKLFAIGWPSLGLFTAEGGQFIGGHGMSDDAKLRTAANLSTLWDGEPIKRVRATDATVIMPGRRLSLHLMAQSAVANIWFRDHLLAGQGLLSRLLMSQPDSAAGTRLPHDEKPETDRDLKRYGARLLSILETPLPLAPGKTNELQPRLLTLSVAARRLWLEFDKCKEAAICAGGVYDSIRPLASKLPEHAARLAAELTLVRDIDSGEIAVAEMAAGIVLAQHYAAETLRLHGGSRVVAELGLAQQALDWMLAHWRGTAISLPDLYQYGPNAIRDAATARNIVAILEDHGWLARIPAGADIAGVHRRDAWRIVRG